MGSLLLSWQDTISREGAPGGARPATMRAFSCVGGSTSSCRLASSALHTTLHCISPLALELLGQLAPAKVVSARFIAKPPTPPKGLDACSPTLSRSLTLTETAIGSAAAAQSDARPS